MTKGAFCAGLPEDFTHGYEPLTEPLTLPTPPVVINSLGDTRTEYVFGRTMANFMAGSSLITYDGTQHVSYLQTPSTCINNAVTRYLLQRIPGRCCAPTLRSRRRRSPGPRASRARVSPAWAGGSRPPGVRSSATPARPAAHRRGSSRIA